MVIFRLCLISFIVNGLLINRIDGVTHWVVTKSGRIQPFAESPFNIRRPYDLLALLDQEKRNNNVDLLFNDLLNRKNSIENKWSNLAYIPLDDICYGMQIANFAFNASDRVDFSMKHPINSPTKDLNPPDCSYFSSIDNNQLNENLLMLQNYSNIDLEADESLSVFLPQYSIDLLGNEIAEALGKNKSSWYHYNLASIYWRVKGDGLKAINCVKRAMQFVPREYMDVPLHNLAGILHQGKNYKEAAIFLHVALDQNPNEAMHYYGLGNVYAVMQENNKSLSYFDKFIAMREDQKEMVVNNHSVYCILMFEKRMLEFQEAHEGILSDLHEYHSQQQQLVRLKERLMWELSSFELQVDGGFQIDAPGKRIQKCVQKMENSKQIISCSFYLKEADYVSLDMQNLFVNLENTKNKLKEQIVRAQQSVDTIKDIHKINGLNVDKGEDVKSPPLLYPKYPNTMSMANDQYFDATGWPSKEDCLAWNLPVDEKDDLDLPVFLPPDNKGFQVKKILSEYIDLPEDAQHKLPWYPPLCEHHNNIVVTNELKASEYLRRQLLQYVNDGKVDEAEIGQRIITATEKKVAPRWVLATLASLYWRIRGNAKRAVDCLGLALHLESKNPTDVVLLSMGSIAYQLGSIEQALKFTTLAYSINYVEPSTNFLLALIHYSNNNPLLAMNYMKNVLRVEPDFYEGKAEKLLKTWGCRIKLGAYSIKESTTERVPVEGMCTTKKESFKGEGVICSPNGDHCKTAAIQCFQTNQGEEEGASGGKAAAACGAKPNLYIDHSLISSLFSGEGSGDIEPDQSKLESISDRPQHSFHMRLSLGDEHPLPEYAGLGDFYVAITLSDSAQDDSLMQIYDKFGTYSLSPSICKTLKTIEQFKYSSVWPSIVSRSLDITSYLKPLPKNFEELKPYCKETTVPNLIRTHLNPILLLTKKKIAPSLPEKELLELLALMASDDKSSLKEIGTKLSLALKENSTSWILATASAMYWRILGNTGQALNCLNLAVSKAPPDMQDIPLVNIANLLKRQKFHVNALEIAHLALKINSQFVMNHFTFANILIAMGHLEKAVTFYRASLAIDSNFEPARNRLQVVLCALLFDESLIRKQIEDLNVN